MTRCIGSAQPCLITWLLDSCDYLASKNRGNRTVGKNLVAIRYNTIVINNLSGMVIIDWTI